ncbi:hypothetical protein F5878DRAFT_648188, partial [Lentinula raphanica]
RQLKIPMSPSFAGELKECSPNETIKIHAEAGDVSAILRQELADSEQVHEQEVAKINERMAYLESRLANANSEGECARLEIGSGSERDESESEINCLENGHDQLESGSVRNAISVLGSISSLRSSATIEKASPQPQRGENSNMRSTILANESRLRVPDSSSYPLRFPQKALAVKWFKDAFEFLNVDLGTSFSAMVTCWFKFEGLNGWKTSRNALSSVNRPEE